MISAQKARHICAEACGWVNTMRYFTIRRTPRRPPAFHIRVDGCDKPADISTNENNLIRAFCLLEPGYFSKRVNLWEMKLQDLTEEQLRSMLTIEALEAALAAQYRAAGAISDP